MGYMRNVWATLPIRGQPRARERTYHVWGMPGWGQARAGTGQASAPSIGGAMSTQLAARTKRRLYDDIQAGQHFQASDSDRAAGLRAHAVLHAFSRDHADHESGAAGAAGCLAAVARQMRGE
jgi:hypothetical protein